MTYRLAKSLVKLRTQLNALFPERDKESDGWIGNAEHASRSSDHNPWLKVNGVGVVTALDVDADIGYGVTCDMLRDALVRSKDRRIKYIIWRGKITSGWDGPAAWVARHYSGPNRHTHHLHISVEDRDNLFDVDTDWILNLVPEKEIGLRPLKLPVLKQGDKGDSVAALQRLLSAHGLTVAEDGDFGARTHRAVTVFQKTLGLEPDGVVGVYTWEKLKSGG